MVGCVTALAPPARLTVRSAGVVVGLLRIEDTDGAIVVVVEDVLVVERDYFVVGTESDGVRSVHDVGRLQHTSCLHEARVSMGSFIYGRVTERVAVQR